MLQLLVEGPHEITREYLEAGQSPQSTPKIEIPKTHQDPLSVSFAHWMSVQYKLVRQSGERLFRITRSQFPEILLPLYSRIKNTGRSECGN